MTDETEKIEPLPCFGCGGVPRITTFGDVCCPTDGCFWGWMTSGGSPERWNDDQTRLASEIRKREREAFEAGQDGTYICNVLWPKWESFDQWRESGLKEKAI